MPHQAPGFKLCASLCNRLWIQTGLRSGNAQIGQNCFGLCNLDLWPLTLIVRTSNSFVTGNYSWKCHDDTMTGILWKRCDGQTDGGTVHSCLVAHTDILLVNLVNNFAADSLWLISSPGCVIQTVSCFSECECKLATRAVSMLSTKSYCKYILMFSYGCAL